MATIETFPVFSILAAMSVSGMIHHSVSKAFCPEKEILYNFRCTEKTSETQNAFGIGMMVFVISAILSLGIGIFSGIPLGWILFPLCFSILWSAIGIFVLRRKPDLHPFKFQP